MYIMKTTQLPSLTFIVIIAFFSLIIGCSKDNTTTGGTPGANEVWLQGSVFNPTTITVAVNTIVK